MAWTHKGIEIEMLGAQFVAECHGKRIVGTSLKSAQKAIDKRLDEKAQEVELSLPVVILRLRLRMWSNDKGPSEMIKRATITGLNGDTKAAQGIDPPKEGSWRNGYILPDTPENAELLAKFIEASRVESECKQRIEELCIRARFSEKSTYAEAVKSIQEQYESALNGKNTHSIVL